MKNCGVILWREVRKCDCDHHSFYHVVVADCPPLASSNPSDQCPVEPTVSFGEALRDRAYWLVGLLLMQSFSGIILSRNEALLADHPVIIFFLTMLVGAGGNAGNQASVRGTCDCDISTCDLERTGGVAWLHSFHCVSRHHIFSIFSIF